MERKYVEGAFVKYVDQTGITRNALVTRWWAQDLNNPEQHGMPGCNLIVVSGDELKSDSYGRQTEHETSVVHKTYQPAYGRFWFWPDEN